MTELIVPASFGGPRVAENVRDVCRRCHTDRRYREAVPDQPVCRAALTRLLTMHPEVRALTLHYFLRAALAVGYGTQRQATYDEREAYEGIRYGASTNFGWSKSTWAWESELSDDDRAFLRSSVAYDAVMRNCYALIPGDAAATWTEGD